MRRPDQRNGLRRHQLAGLSGPLPAGPRLPVAGAGAARQAHPVRLRHAADGTPRKLQLRLFSRESSGHHFHAPMRRSSRKRVDLDQIYDGMTEMDPLLGRFCSSSNPAPLTSSGDLALLRFHSDDSLSDTGFHITCVSHRSYFSEKGSSTNQT